MYMLGDDHQALIWDIQQMTQTIEVPILAYMAQTEINQVQWSICQSDWIAICFEDNLTCHIFNMKSHQKTEF